MSDSTAWSAAIDAIDAAAGSLTALSLDIHAHPEENYEEFHAHAALTSWLSDAGWDVRASAYGMETAFEARGGSTSANAPTLAVLCEYDALPGIGHACGHNLIAASGVAAGLGVAAAVEQSGLDAAIRILGSPAEEGGGGKIRLIDAGAFADVGAAMMLHPSPGDMVRPSVLAIDTCMVEFQGRNAHAAAAPWEGRNALDALVLAYQAIGLLRQQSKPDVRIHGKIHHGGDKPNIIPDRAAAEFYVRGKDDATVDDVIARVEACFRGAAEAAGCSVSVEWQPGERYSNMANNGPLAETFGRRWLDLGVRASDLDRPGSGGFGSTDMGNVSHVVPSIHPMYAIPTEAGNHTPGFTAAAATDAAHDSTFTAAKALAQTALDWLTNAELRDAAQADFDESHRDSDQES